MPKKSVFVIIPKEKIEEYKNMIIYNYLASLKKEFTEKTVTEDLKRKYNLSITTNEAKKIIREYVRNGLITFTLHSYKWVR
mgnify:FL=1